MLKTASFVSKRVVGRARHKRCLSTAALSALETTEPAKAARSGQVSQPKGVGVQPPRPVDKIDLNPRPQDIEADIRGFSEAVPSLVSLRSLVEVGLGTRPWLSSIRDALSNRDPTPHNERLSPRALHYTPRERGILRMALFLHRELPVRFARGVDQLDSLPLMQQLPDIREVRSWYAESFKDIRTSPRPETKEAEKHFVKTLEKVRERHAEELVMMARGIYDLRSTLRRMGKPDVITDIHSYLDRFYLKRIALRILVGHYLALHGESRENYVGIVCRRTRVRDVVETAVSDAKWICKEKYGNSPPVVVLGGENLTFYHVPEHLYYMMMELLKNSLRAVAEKHGVGEKAPPITIIVSRDYSLTEGQQVVIRIQDSGGGIPPEAFEKIWCYLFTTADPCVQQAMIGSVPPPAGRYGGSRRAVPLAGLGYGLPLSRLYAQYFGGDLELYNRWGEGLDVVLKLSRLGDQKEPLV